MKKIHFLILIVFASTLGSCRMVSFTETPGTEVSSVPEDWHGRYVNIVKRKGVRDTHTLVIGKEDVEVEGSLVNVKKEWTDTGLVLSNGDQFYYLSIKGTDNGGTEYYVVYPMLLKGDVLYVYKIQLSKKNMRRLIKCGLQESGRRVGEFSMNKEGFSKFVKKYLRKKHSIQFVKE